MALIDLAGQKFGRLLVIERVGLNAGGNATWKCLCDCGTEKILDGNSIRRGFVKSCGCLAKDTASRLNQRHGMTGTKVHKAWLGILFRCNNPNAECYHNYGGRGIRVEFASFEEFYAEIGDPPTPKHTVERIDNEKGYAPGNVKWATMDEQRRNSRQNKFLTINGKTQTVADWAKETNLPDHTILTRLNRSKSAEESVAPVTLGTMSLSLNGETHTVIEWAMLTGIPEDVIRMRMFRKWPVHKILSQAVRDTEPLVLTLNGRTQTICEWLTETGMPRKVLEHRLRRGWSTERALTEPLRNRRN
jgi:hypothetical protein